MAILAEGLTLTKEVGNTNQKGIYCPNCGSWNITGRKSCHKCETTLHKEKWELGNKIALFALVIAFISILLGAYTVHQADRTVHTNVKPLLDIRISESSDGIHSIILKNHGLGPAVITGVQYYKYGKKLKDLGSSLTNLPYNAPYSKSTFDNHSYIQKDEELHLAEITSDDLKQKNYNGTQIHEIIKSWRDDLNKTTIKIDYADVLGEPQNPLDRTTNFPYHK